MGLEAEEFEESEKRRPVADYVLAREDGEKWDEWFQSNRYELNAMTTRQILDWLEAKDGGARRRQGGAAARGHR